MKKRWLVSTVALAVASALFVGYWTRGKAANAKGQEAGAGAAASVSMQSVQKFGYGLMGQCLKGTNPVLSPVSAYAVLSMVGNGAKGATEKEFQNVLGSDMLSASRSLMDTLPQDKEGTKLTIANSAWMDKTEFTAKKAWRQTAKSQFRADVFQTKLGTDATKDKVNQWVSERTNKMIPKLLEKKLDGDTRLALLNALYFHADWQQQFQAWDTSVGEFRLDGGTAKNADLMHATMRECGYFKDKASEGVVLPYADSSFAFVAVKPTGEESIRDWYASYTADKLNALIGSRETKAVALTLPKFTVRCRLDLNGGLKKLGLKKAFDSEKADLSLLGKSRNGENLYLSLVLQEAVVSVAEEGTEAAAATVGAVAMATSMLDGMQTVCFDRPFLYMIMDMDSGAPVFMGIMDQPEK